MLVYQRVLCSMLIFQGVDPRHLFEKTTFEFVALFRRPDAKACHF